MAGYTAGVKRTIAPSLIPSKKREEFDEANNEMDELNEDDLED